MIVDKSFIIEKRISGSEQESKSSNRSIRHRREIERNTGSTIDIDAVDNV